MTAPWAQRSFEGASPAPPRSTAMIALTVGWSHLQRDLIRFRRSYSQLSGAMAGPILLLLAIGLGVGSAASLSTEIATVLVPGLAGMVVLLVASSQSIELCIDRQSGLIRETLVGPGRNWMPVVARMLSAALVGLFLAPSILLVAASIGLGRVPEQPVSFVLGLAAFAAFSSCLTVALATRADHPGQLGGYLNLITNPMFFLSGALFEVDGAPELLRWLVGVNPMHHAIRLAQHGYVDNLALTTAELVVSLLITVGSSIALLRYATTRIDR